MGMIIEAYLAHRVVLRINEVIQVKLITQCLSHGKSSINV
jgi:hypothetical protein